MAPDSPRYCNAVYEREERDWLLEATKRPQARPWMGVYVGALRESGSHTRAARVAEISREHAWRCRRHGPIEFAQACWAASFERACAWRAANGDWREPGEWRES